jgi:hypothetical protein
MTETLSPGVVRRLARLKARLEGAQAAAQGAAGVAQQLSDQYRDAVLSALEDAGIRTPPDDGVQRNLKIDWQTGDVTFTEAEGMAMNGVVQ